MFLLSFMRIIKFGIQDIYRNIWLSIVTLTILILALFSINMLLIVSVISDSAISAVKNKIDISLYLETEANETEIMALKAKLGGLSEVKEIKYVSKEDALNYFREKNQDKPEVLQALRELGKNPLTPSLVLIPKDADQVQNLIIKLNSETSEIIESKNFSDHKLLLSKINAITKKVRDVGLFVSLIFIFTTLLVVYNAIRVAIYTHRKEIGIMRLVGASDWFIYMPFLLSGLIYALVGIGAIILIFYPFLSILQPYLETFFSGYNVNVITYFNDNFLKIFGLEFLGIVAINTVASLIAIRKYAKV